jgi:hypothetical protein
MAEEPEPQPQAEGAASAWHWDSSKFAERAARCTLNTEGGLETSEVTPGKVPSQELDDPFIDNFLAARMKDHGVKLLMICTRTDNSNTVCYACKLTEGQQVADTKEIIDMYWEDVEPATQVKLRKKSHMSNRTEFGMLDNMGYGLGIEQKDGGVFVTMTAMPAELKQEFTLVWVNGEPRLQGKVNGKDCWMEKLYIETKKRTLNPIPKILFVRIFGTAIADGSKEMQQVTP